MNGVKLFKKFLMPCGLCAAVPVIKSQAKEQPTNLNNENQTKTLIRPSELPIYTFEKAEPREPPCIPAEQGVVEQSFASVRKTVQDFLKQFTGYTDVITHTIDTGYAHSQVTLDYLREESNVLPRVGAIGLGGLSGLILALRSGKFKKLVYTSTGALTVAAICYPKQAQETVVLAKYYVNVGYNFLYGVKPGDEDQLEISWPTLPKVPKNMSQFSEIAGNAAGSAYSAAGTLINKGVKAFNELIEDPPSPYEKPKSE